MPNQVRSIRPELIRDRLVWAFHRVPIQLVADLRLEDTLSTMASTLQRHLQVWLSILGVLCHTRVDRQRIIPIKQPSIRTGGDCSQGSRSLELIQMGLLLRTRCRTQVPPGMRRWIPEA